MLNLVLLGMVKSTIVIGADNVSEILSYTKHKPVFVGLFSQWCPHCAEFHPAWKKIEKFFKNDPNVTIATVSCDFDRELCSNFSGTGTPRLFFATRDVQNAYMYEGPRTFPEVKNFIQKKTQPPLRIIENLDELNKQLAANINSSIFLIQDLKHTRITKIIKSNSEKYENTQSLFFWLNFKLFDEVKPMIKYIFPLTNYNSTIAGKFISRRKLLSFLDEHAYPTYVEFSSTFHKFQTKLNEPILVLDDGKKDFEGKLIDYSVDFPDGLKSTRINCYIAFKFCQSIKLPMENKPSIGMYNPYRNTYYVYNGNLTREEIVPWVHRVWERKEKELGPGRGLRGWYIRNIKVNLKNPLWWLQVVAVIFIIGLLFYLIYLVISLKKVKIIKED